MAHSVQVLLVFRSEGSGADLEGGGGGGVGFIGMFPVLYYIALFSTSEILGRGNKSTVLSTL